MTRLLRIGLAALSLMAGSLTVSGEDVAGLTVRLQVYGAAAAPPRVVLELTGEGDDEPLSRVEAVAPGPVDVVPPGEPPWTLRTRAEGYWSAPLVVEPPLEGPRIVHLWPEVRLRGRVVVPEGRPEPEGISVRLQKEEGVGGLAPGIEAAVLCPLAEGRLDCRMPAVAGLDLRLRVPGFASRFFWDLDLSGSAVHDLGTVRLRAGASVVGHVEVPSGYAPEDALARLMPARGAPTLNRDGLRVEQQVTSEERVDERGFFSLEGLAAGSYRLEVTHPDLATFELNPVRVRDGSQTEVSEPIRLAEPTPLRLVLDPPFDPHGEDWVVELFRELPSGQKVAVLGGREISSTAGVVEATLPSGRYEARVFDSRGVHLATEEVVADPTGAPQVLTLEPVFVDGRVTLGDDPVLARVTFHGPSTLEMDADLEGRFSGYLPRAGEWDVAVKAIEPPIEWRTRVLEIEIDEDEDRALVHLRLPDTTLRGTVVDEQGSPAAGAEVTVSDPLFTGRPVSTSTGPEGDFLLRGLDEGRVHVQAMREEDGGSWSSRAQIAHLFEDDSAEVRLVLRPHAFLRGRIVAADGNPLPNAWIEISPYDEAGRLDFPSAQSHASDATGRFAISLPRSIGVVDVTLMAPGHPLTQVAVPLGDLGDLPLGFAAGDLVLDLPGRLDEMPWADPTQPRPGLVGPAGVRLYLGALIQWSGLHGHPWRPEASQVTLPLLAPGRYAVCWFRPEEWLSRSATGSDCVAGEVREGGTIGLRLNGSPDGGPGAK